MSPLAESIVCVECGGTAHLLQRFTPEDPPMAGDIVAYRCSDCVDRFDVVVDDADLDDD
jgi:predicted nucleic acid-binding Zn ribbon protein